LKNENFYDEVHMYSASAVYTWTQSHDLFNFISHFSRYINTDPSSTDDDTAPTDTVDSPLNKPTILGNLNLSRDTTLLDRQFVLLVCLFQIDYLNFVV